MIASLETARLRLREFSEDDAPFVLQLLNEPSFHEFIGDRGVRTLEDAKRYLREGPIASYRLNGHGLMHLALRTNDQPIGMCGLVRRDTLPSPDIGFALLPEYWNQGYVTEAAAASIDHGRRHLGLREVLGITTPRNTRSIRVLEKLGLRFREQRALTADSAELRIFGLALATLALATLD